MHGPLLALEGMKHVRCTIIGSQKMYSNVVFIDGGMHALLRFLLRAVFLESSINEKYVLTLEETGVHARIATLTKMFCPTNYCQQVIPPLPN